jgi:fructose-bisphosphate aldolase class 1
MRSHALESVALALVAALFEQGVALQGVLLKPNMVIAGKQCASPASVEEVAAATWSCLRRHAPAAVPGIVFLSGGQQASLATAGSRARSPGRSASPTGGRSRIRRWRYGTGGTRTSRSASRLFTTERA